MKKFFYIITAFVIVFVIISFISCGEPTPVTGGPVEFAKLVDGVYDGSYKGGPNSAVVKVTIKDKKIANIEIVEHNAWKGKKAEPIIVKEIIEKQSTKVDAVTGATNSSNVIMNAVQKAIEKAYQS
ncbi:MAG: hypothetical protein QG641_304 [Candidatus Poribacteria bacterium]|nr:hypothetical protein [Candidatus Poribacteria bacterium]MDQ1327024.1 hypothetical protein [Candidatus Poribacteria bacterium]